MSTCASPVSLGMEGDWPLSKLATRALCSSFGCAEAYTRGCHHGTDRTWRFLENARDARHRKYRLSSSCLKFLFASELAIVSAPDFPTCTGLLRIQLLCPCDQGHTESRDRSRARPHGHTANGVPYVGCQWGPVNYGQRPGFKHRSTDVG